jgi:hypothetical protein
LAGETELSAERHCPFSHSLESKSGRVALWLESLSIIHNLKMDQVFALLEMDADLGCGTMFGDVREGFLNDAIESSADFSGNGLGELQGRMWRDAGGSLEFGDCFGDRSFQRSSL